MKRNTAVGKMDENIPRIIYDYNQNVTGMIDFNIKLMIADMSRYDLHGRFVHTRTSDYIYFILKQCTHLSIINHIYNIIIYVIENYNEK